MHYYRSWADAAVAILNNLLECGALRWGETMRPNMAAFCTYWLSTPLPRSKEEALTRHLAAVRSQLMSRKRGRHNDDGAQQTLFAVTQAVDGMLAVLQSRGCRCDDDSAPALRDAVEMIKMEIQICRDQIALFESFRLEDSIITT
jgi:hypothetical protein